MSCRENQSSSKRFGGSAIKLKNNPTTKLLRQSFLRIVVYGFTYTAAIFGMLVLMIILSNSVTWYSGDPLYRFLHTIEQMLVVLLPASLIGGYLVIVYWQLKKSYHYLDELAEGITNIQKEDQELVYFDDAALQPLADMLNDTKISIYTNMRAAKEAEQRKNDLIVYLAHDLKTPMTSIIGYLSLLEDEPDLSVQARARYTHIALEKAYRLEELVNEFFEITRFNLTHQVLEPGRVDMVRMLEQMAYEFKPLLSPRHLDIALDLPEQCIWYVDVEKMERVFDNLLRNAINYAFDDSTIQISLCVVDQKLILKFENAGNTIPPEKLSRLFEQFFRLDESRSTAKGGAGLGLAIAKTIVEWHHGTITVESHDERIIFTVTLPQLS